MDRLEKSSGFKGKVVVASTGVKPRTMVEEEGGKPETITDPHAWQDLGNGKLYVANIRDGLIAADPDGKAVYEANAAKYLDAIAKEESAVKQALATLPEARRKIITSHDAFGYFGAAYGLRSSRPRREHRERSVGAGRGQDHPPDQGREDPGGVHREHHRPSPAGPDRAGDGRQDRRRALFRCAVGADGPAPTYLDMFRHNVGALTAALSS